MTATSQQQHIATPDFFNDNDLPPRGFLGDIIAVITRPIEFFMTFDVQRMSKHTLWMALLILVIVAANTLQMRAPAEDSAPQDINVPPVMDGEMFGEEGMPFDPSMMGGNIGGEGTSEADDPAADWTTALSAIAAQLLQWGVLTLLLSAVTMFKGHSPRFGVNLQIVVWATLPLALMALLQLAFLAGGGSIQAEGFSGLLSEWPAFADMNIYLRSFIYALASLLTVFWIWNLALIYLGSRLILRGNPLIVLMVLAAWVVMLGFANSIESYERLETEASAEAEMFPGEMFPGGMMPQDGMFPDQMVPDGMIPGEMGPGSSDMPSEQDPSISPDTEMDPLLQSERSVTDDSGSEEIIVPADSIDLP